MTPASGLFVRHEVAHDWCLIASIDRCSIRTRCNGAMNRVGERYEIEAAPPIADRCSACVEPIEGVTQPIELVTFEMVDDRFDDGGES